MKTRSLQLLGVSCLLHLAVGAVAFAAAPNILFIAVDDLRPELGCYGEAHMHTPNMDKLATSGRLFLNHYVSVPTCGASRYAMMTGLRPTTATDDNNAFNYMPTSQPASPESWVDLLRRNGWHTVSLGKITHEPDGYRWNYPVSYDIGRSSAAFPDMRYSWNEILFGHDKWGAQRYPLFAYADGTGRIANVSPAFEIGVDAQGHSLPDEAYPDGQMAQAAIEKLREFADDKRRFCLALGFFKPHLPFNAPKAYYNLYNPATLPGPNPTAKPTGAESSTVVQSGEKDSYTANGDISQLRQAYFACVSYVDAQVGKVLDELQALGLADNTVVIFWGDHGWFLGDQTLLGKHCVLERGVHSPLIIRVPASAGGDPFAGVPADGIVETVDLYPTIAELCGLTLPSGPVGNSLVPLLRNPFAPGKDWAYSRYGSVATVRSPAWRLVNSTTGNDLYDLSTNRFEVQDVSAANPGVVATLSVGLTTQGIRHGTTNYTAWAAGNPALIDGAADADHDGENNLVEYLSGTDPLNPESRPSFLLEWRDLGAGSEPVYRFTASLAPDDLRFRPVISSNLVDWSFSALMFLEKQDLGGGLANFYFRLSEPAGVKCFFCLELSPD